MKKIKKLILMMSFVAILLTSTSCAKVIENPLVIPEYVKKEPTYITELVEKQTIYDTDLIYSRVNPIKEEIYSFEYSSGYIDQIVINKGDAVVAGDLLVTMLDDELLKTIRDMEISYEIEHLKIEKLLHTYETTGNGKYELDLALLDFKIVQHQYDELKIKQDALNLYATFDGEVDSIKVTLNKYINKGDDVIKVVDNSDTYLSFTDPNIGGLIVGSEVDLYIDKQNIIKATVVEINKKDKMVIVQPNEFDELLEEIGKLFKIEITIDQINDAIAVKKAWIQEAAGRQFVYVLENGVVMEREVSLGKELGEWVEVLLGLEVEDEIIINSN